MARRDGIHAPGCTDPEHPGVPGYSLQTAVAVIRSCLSAELAMRRKVFRGDPARLAEKAQEVGRALGALRLLEVALGVDKPDLFEQVAP